MRCKQAQTLMDSYLNEGLSPDEREPLEIHLRDCGACQQKLEHLQNLLAVLRSDPSPPVPNGLVDRIMARAKDQETTIANAKFGRRDQSQSAWKKLEFSAGIAAALAAGLLVGLFMGHQAWRNDHQQEIASAIGPTDPAAPADFEYLIDPGGDSLAQAYLELTATADH